MRRLLKFSHTLGAAAFMGGMAALVVVICSATGADGRGPPLDAMAKITVWIIGPSMMLTVMSGLLAIAVHPGFHEAGWAWLKAATGILVLEGGLHVLGPIQEEARRGAGLAGASDPTSLARLLTAEANTLWLLLAVSVVNIALGVWRPRLPQIPV